MGKDEGVSLGLSVITWQVFSLLLYCILAGAHGCLSLDVGVVRTI